MPHPSKLLEDLARRTWRRIVDGHHLCIRQSETTITDYLLLEIERNGSPRIRTIQTSIKKEANQGTDWEWWVGSSSQGWIQYVIQAKRVRFPSGRYDGLKYKVRSIPQIDILINHAKKENAVPLYCLYNAIDESSLKRYWQCCNMSYKLKQFGCTMAHAQDVKQFLSEGGRGEFEDIHKNLTVRPWRCLVSCPRILCQYPGVSCPGESQHVSNVPPLFSAPKVHKELPEEIKAAFERRGRAASKPGGKVGNYDVELDSSRLSYFPRYVTKIEIF
jgi:hypothetical protein